MARPHVLFLVILLAAAPLAAFAPSATATHAADDSPLLLDHMPGLPEARKHAAAVWTGTHIYLFGGIGADGDESDDAIVYDPADPASARVLPFPDGIAGRAGAAAVWTGSEVILHGGYNDTCGDGCYVYFDGIVTFDPATERFAQVVADALKPALDTTFMAAAYVGGKAYFFGGCSVYATGCTSAVRVYDPATPAVAPAYAGYGLPRPTGGALALVEASGDVLVVGGREGSTFLDTVVRVTPATGANATLARTLPAPRAHAGGFLLDERFYLLGGENSAGAMRSIERYHVATPSVLTLGTALPGALSGAASVLAGDFAYLLGGGDAAATSAVLQFSPAPLPVGASVTGTSLTLTTHRALSTATTGGFTLTVNGRAFSLSSATPDGTTLTLTVPAGVANEDTARLSYAGGATVDSGGHELRRFTDLAVSVATPAGTLPAAREHPAAVWTGAEALLFGGLTDGACLGGCASGTTLVHWPSNGTFVSGPDPTRACCMSAVWTGTSAYLFGGRGSDLAAALRYDRASDTFVSAGASPALQHMSAAYDGSRYVYLFGGTSPSSGFTDALPTSSNAVHRYDTTDGSLVNLSDLQPAATLPTPRYGTAAAWLASADCPGGCAYVLGGYAGPATGAAPTADILRFDPTAGEVTTLATTLPTARAYAGAFAAADSILLLGGYGSAGIDQALRFFPARAELLALPAPLAAPRYGAGLAWTGTTAHLLGGSDGAARALAPIAYTPDLTPPTPTATPSPAAPDGIGGWYTSPVSVALGVVDAGPGAATVEASLYDGITWSATTPIIFDAAGQQAGTTYDVTLRARDASGNLATVAQTYRVDTVAPTATPGGDSGTIGGPGASVTFAFPEAMDAPSTEAALTGADGWTRAWNVEGTLLTLTHADLPYGTHTLTLATTARDAHGVPLAASASRTVTRDTPPPPPPPPPPAPPAPQPPEPPEALGATLDGANATLSWQPPLQDHGAPVTGYRIYVDGTLAAETTATTADLTLARGQPHTLHVTALNSAGESGPAATSLAVLPASTLHTPEPATSGWHLAPPTISFTTDPSEATLLLDLGAGEIAHAGNLTLAAGETTLTWRAIANGLAEPTRAHTFRVDTLPPTFDAAFASSDSLVPGATLTLTARASDAHSGIAAVEGQLAPHAGGAATLVPMTRGDDGAFRGSATPPEGNYDITIVAHDAAGHEARAPTGAVAVAAVAEPMPTPETPPAGDAAPDDPLQSTSAGAGGADEDAGTLAQPSAPGDASPESEGGEVAAPQLVIEQPEDIDVGVDAGARGIVTIRLTGVADATGLVLVVVDQAGVERELARDVTQATWDTTESGDGHHTIEARRDGAAGSTVLASADVLVRNAASDVGQVILAVVAGAGVIVLVGVGASAAAGGSGLLGALSNTGTSASSGAALSGFDALGFAQEVAGDAGEDKLRDKAKAKEAKLLERRRSIRSAAAAIGSLVILAALWALSEVEAWTVLAWLRALPLVGAAAAIVMLLKYTTEMLLARVTLARPRVKLLLSGALALAVSSIVFRNPFGYPGYVEEVAQAKLEGRRRVDGIRSLAIVAGSAAFLLPFLLVSSVLPWDFVSAGLLIAVTNVATSAMPFGPLPGKDIWRWSKPLAVGVAFAGFAFYVLYAAALAPMWLFWTSAVLGAAAYAGVALRFHRTLGARRRAVRVPLATEVPVHVEEAPQRHERARER